MLRRYFSTTTTSSVTAATLNKKVLASTTSSFLACFSATRNISFVDRHIGPNDDELGKMLQTIKESKVEPKPEDYENFTNFAKWVVPDGIQRPPMTEFEGDSEADALHDLRVTMSKNKPNIKSLIGQGYFEAILPPTIQRNVLENAGWYTPYTPYQAEISQGRLESLLYYQTTITEMTKMPLANASLLDEATAAWEAVSVCYHFHKKSRSKFFVAQSCYKSTIEMVSTRAATMGIEIVVGDIESFTPDEAFCGMMVQTPDTMGIIRDFTSTFTKAHEKKVLCCVATDLMACVSTKPPGDMAADIVFGNAQRFGIPLGYGGPHPAFFALRDAFKRLLPGRLIGWSEDVHGKKALRMALQTREQHIKRENATSNICTAQALLANMVAFYSIYHGRDGLQIIADRIHRYARIFAGGLQAVGFKLVSDEFFDTVTFKVPSSSDFVAKAVKKNINVFAHDEETISVSMDEATKESHLIALLECAGLDKPKIETLEQQCTKVRIPENLQRSANDFMNQEVYGKYRSETAMMRFMARLQSKDYGLQHGMIPLGSCTMKLNPAATMLPLSWPEVGNIHPLVPINQAEGYRAMTVQLEKRLCEISGLDACSLQPNSGAQGEYAGIRVIREYLRSRGETERNVCFIPNNAHGTNPATAHFAGMKIVKLDINRDGEIDLAHLKSQCEKYSKTLACVMITYPSTYGVFDRSIKEITQMIHDNGGQVYIDGANFNAMVGLTGPGFIGGDVCHFNLHKTFSIPHGGGGPGMGPICVKEHLAPFLPNTAVAPAQVGGSRAFGQTSQAPYGSASILTISSTLINMLGTKGLHKCSCAAITSANYLAARLHKHYDVLYKDKKTGCVAHEFIIDLNKYKKLIDLEAEDVAKRLMDYGFHAPTLAFPVAGTLMVEPTESEPKEELDRFVDAMIAIRGEIEDIVTGKVDKVNNVLKNSPHPMELCMADEWKLPYTREKAAYPVAGLRENKFWPSVGRVKGAFGDLNLHCCASN